MLGEHSYKYLTVDEMKSLGDDSMPIDVTHDEKHQQKDGTLTKTSAMTTAASSAAPSSIEAKLREMEKDKNYELNEKMFAPDNVDLPHKQAPVSIG